MEGAVEGVIAFLLAPPARAAVLEALGVAPAATESALREVGNIVASHAVSAVADHLGGRVTLSVPILVQEDAGPVLDRLLAERRGGRAGIVTTTEMRLHSGSTCGLLVFAPD